MYVFHILIPIGIQDDLFFSPVSISLFDDAYIQCTKAQITKFCWSIFTNMTYASMYDTQLLMTTMMMMMISDVIMISYVCVINYNYLPSHSYHKLIWFWIDAGFFIYINFFSMKFWFKFFIHTHMHKWLVIISCHN